MLNKKPKAFKIFLFCNLFLLLIGAGVTAHYIFFTQVDIKIEEIKWLDEFKIEIAKINLKERPDILVISPNKAIIKSKRLEIKKQNIEIGHQTNNQILIPFKIKSNIERDKNLFFIPQFRAKITGAENLKANFALYLKTTQCQKEQEKIKGNNFVFCNTGIYSGEPGPYELTKSFNITDRRKNILAEKIRTMTNKNNYVLALKIIPDLEVIKNLSSFSIIIENITPELIYGLYNGSDPL